METLVVVAVVAAAAAWAAVRLARKLAAPPARNPSCSGCSGCGPSPGAARSCPAMPHTFAALHTPEPKPPRAPSC